MSQFLDKLEANLAVTEVQIAEMYTYCSRMVATAIAANSYRSG